MTQITPHFSLYLIPIFSPQPFLLLALLKIEILFFFLGILSFCRSDCLLCFWALFPMCRIHKPSVSPQVGLDEIFRRLHARRFVSRISIFRKTILYFNAERVRTALKVETVVSEPPRFEHRARTHTVPKPQSSLARSPQRQRFYCNSEKCASTRG